MANKSFDNELNDSSTIAEKNTLEYALSQGKFKGLLRYSGQYRDSNLQLAQDSFEPIPNEKQQQYTTIGGYLGYETAPLFNTSIGATLYTSQAFGNNPDDRKGLGGLYENNGKQESYTVFGEVFAKFDYQNHLIKVGRQEMPDYRFVSLSDIRMTPLTHEGIIYENSTVNNLKLNFAYITKMKERNAEKFIDMAKAARIKVLNSGKKLIRGSYDSTDYFDNEYVGDKKEMSMFGLNYNNKSITLEGWNYYINDFINTIYLYGQYNLTPKNSDFLFSLSAQYAKQSDVGKRIAGNIDTWFYGLKFQASLKKTTFFIAYNEVDYNEKSYDGGTIFVRWGSPQMFNSFQVQDSELAGTKSTGLGVQHQFSQNSIIPGVIMRLRYGYYNMPDKLSQKDARQDRTETTFDINYAFRKTAKLANVPLDGLSVQFRLAYNNYDTDYDFNAYKEIHKYDFATVTDDFVDARLYLNYNF
jgi:hypothetical protein